MKWQIMETVSLVKALHGFGKWLKIVMCKPKCNEIIEHTSGQTISYKKVEISNNLM